MMRRSGRSGVQSLMCAILGIALISPGLFGQGKSLADLYRTGKVRFVSEITITDATMGGKDFFVAPSDLAFDDQGTIYVCDSRANNIKVFDATGKYLKTVGKTGQGPGDLNYPVEIEFSAGKLYIRELMNSRISIFDQEGNFIKSVPILEVGISWWNIAALPDGRFVVEREITNIRNPRQPQECLIELYSSEFEFVKSIYSRNIWRNKYITEPRTTNVPVPFAPLVYWRQTSAGRIVIGYSEKYEVEIHDPDRGKIRSFIHDYRPAEVTSTDKEQYFKGMTTMYSSSSGVRSTQRGAADYIVKLTEFPKFKPAFNAIQIDPEDNIWIRPWSVNQIGVQSFDVFMPDGTFIGKVELGKDSIFPSRIVRQKSGFWGIKMNADGEYSISKMRIEAEK
jgi:hypothetical protein